MMSLDEAKQIHEKMSNCVSRIMDTHYCEEMSCEGCEYNVSAELREQALQILKENDK